MKVHRAPHAQDEEVDGSDHRRDDEAPDDGRVDAEVEVVLVV